MHPKIWGAPELGQTANSPYIGVRCTALHPRKWGALGHGQTANSPDIGVRCTALHPRIRGAPDHGQTANSPYAGVQRSAAHPRIWECPHFMRCTKAALVPPAAAAATRHNLHCTPVALCQLPGAPQAAPASGWVHVLLAMHVMQLSRLLAGQSRRLTVGSQRYAERYSTTAAALHAHNLQYIMHQSAAGAPAQPEMLAKQRLCRLL